ncbi:MAG: branched-chain amino acid ABC transporter permease, partial [Thermodesulfobacteriota bacterium]
FRILRLQAVVIVATGVLLAALFSFIQYTRIGKAIRALSEDKEAAALMGVDVDWMISITFVIGGLAAGAAGVLYALMFKQVHFFMGFIPGIKAFTAAVLGGIGNIPGAMLGGLFLGLIESIGPSLFLDGLGIVAPYQLKDAIAFTMLVLILIFRPTGILGERLAVKKA